MMKYLNVHISAMEILKTLLLPLHYVHAENSQDKKSEQQF